MSRGSAALRFGEMELERLFGGRDLGPFLEWRAGVGVFVRPLSVDEATMGGLTEELVALRTQHPLGNLDEPALPFPCTAEQFKAFVSLPTVRMNDAIENWVQAEEADIHAFSRIAPHAAALIPMIRGPGVRGRAGAIQSEAQRLAEFELAWSRVGDERGATKELARMFSVSDRTIRHWKARLLESRAGTPTPQPKAKPSASALQDVWHRPRRSR
jgi:hypothetical protein